MNEHAALANTPTPYQVSMDTVSHNMNLLIYGPQGSGKTTLASTAQDMPDMRDVLVLNFEGGLISISHREDIKAIDISSISDLEAAFWALQRGDYEGIRTVVLDSVTEMQTLSLEEIAKERVRKKGGVANIDEIALQDYGKSTAQLRRLLRWFRDLPLNVIMTALPKTFSFGQEDRPPEMRTPSVIKPALTNALAESVMGYMDFVWYYYMRTVPLMDKNNKQTGERTERVLITRDRGPIKAKTRGRYFADSLDDGIVVNPTLSDLFSKLQETQRQS